MEDEQPQTEEFVVGDSFARVLTETTQSLVCVYDRDGRILLFNEACERATGFTRDEVLGRNARDVVIPPEERDAFGEFLAYVWTARTSSPQVGHWMTKDGGRRLIAWSNRPMAGEAGAQESLVTTGIDLTDRAPRHESGERALPVEPGAKLAEISRLAAEQRSLRRVATLVASEVSPERVFMAVSEECARVLEVNASVVVRYEGDGSATIVGRHNRDGIDVFHLGARARRGDPLRARAGARVRDARARGRLGRALRADGGGDVPWRLPLDGGRADRRARCAVGCRRDRQRGPAAAGDGEPARRVLRDGVARGRERAGARGSHRLARAARDGGRRAAPAPGAQPPRRRAAEPRVRRAEAAPRACARGAGPRRRDAAARGRDARARHGPGGAARDRPRHPSRRSSASAGCGRRWRR